MSNSASWSSCLLGDVTYESTDRAGANADKLPVFGVDSAVGLTRVPKYQAATLGKYKRIKYGMYAYNPMRLNIGSIGLCTSELAEGLVSPDYVVFGCNPSRLCSRFFRHYIHGPQWRSWTEASGVGSVRVRIYYSELARMPLALPSLHEQQAIARILDTLNDKIDLIRQMNETLEMVVRTLFRSWFVDFEPVRAKVEGLQPKGMNAATAALFPDSFVDSKLGKIPSGWRVGSVRELCLKVENGGTPKREIEGYWTPAEVPWLTSGEVRQQFVIQTEQSISQNGFQNCSAKLWPAFTTVVALYGATAGLATMLGVELCSNQACCGLIPNDNSACFLHQAILDSRTRLQQQTRGSAQQNLSQSIVADLECVIPTQQLLARFESSVRVLYLKCIEGINQSHTLAALRDILLPKLLSGEVRIGDAEQAAGETNAI